MLELDWHQRYKIALGAAKGIAYLHVGFEKYAIPHRLDVGIALSFCPIKGSPPFYCNTHFSPPLKADWSITQLFWVFTFCLNFLGN